MVNNLLDIAQFYSFRKPLQRNRLVSGSHRMDTTK